jgi:methylenetetrahydrofolate dehydrogenase (NADP+) / methenyltetrahydrofolate cyclohydrolase
MPAILLDGKKVAEHVYSKLLLDISLLPTVPKIVFVLVGEDGASQTYVRMKGKKCTDLGLRGETLRLPSDTTESQLLTTIHRLNADAEVNGILVQLPLPRHIDKNKVLREINPAKDVDGLHPDNAGRLFQGDPRFVPCTPFGVMEILKFYSIPVEGKNAVVIGRSEIVGKPMAQLLLAANATVTICHSKTRDLPAVTRQADILVAALGRPRFVTDEMVKPGATVIDVGIHRIDDKIVGDVDFDKVSQVASHLTPVPGGVGPMTIAMLMKNLVLSATSAAKSRGELKKS